jgi:hypothetical protein
MPRLAFNSPYVSTPPELPNYFLAQKIASLTALAACNLSTVFVGILMLWRGFGS